VQERQELVLIDVRGPQAFEQVRIPGSLNIPLFAVKTKAFLKDKPLVLVDEGFRPRRLADACDQLRQAGFEARFLFGGLNAWRTRSANFNLLRSAKLALPRSAHVNLLPLQGDVFAQNALNTMPPQALFAEQGSEYWLLLDVSAVSGNAQSLPDNAATGSPGSAGILPAIEVPDGKERDAGKMPALPGTLPGRKFSSRALSVPFDRENPEPFLAHVEQTVALSSAWSEGFLILIYNRHGEDYEAIERVLRKTPLAPVFFLKGGIEAYTQFVAQQRQIKQGQHQERTTSCHPCAR
jgi:rhodanese-related sulfurtransferase